jgi:SAM-dependent methyltransferase
MSSDDRYASFDYSTLINWNDRLPREWAFLDPVLRAAPSNTILDLGSGTGEHARFLASKGFDVTGIDASTAMVEKARAGGGTFIEGDMREVATLAGERRFGAALCLGNALPHLTADDDLHRLARGLRAVLLPDAPFVLQLLNYDRIEAKRERALPLTFLAGGLLFLRAMELRENRRVIFMPTILRIDTSREPPIELVASQRVEIRGWRAEEIERAFRDAGFASIELFGSYQRAPFEKTESRDVILVGVR